MSCRAQAEVVTPDAILRLVACGKPQKGHGRWHRNRAVYWPGRYDPAETIGEVSERLIDSVFGPSPLKVGAA